MVELVNKREALSVVKTIPCASLEEEFTKSVAESCIKRLPTMTETEIRAKAIDEMFERIKTHTEVIGTICLEDIDKIAEQLKKCK